MRHLSERGDAVPHRRDRIAVLRRHLDRGNTHARCRDDVREGAADVDCEMHCISVVSHRCHARVLRAKR
jgi:hypothetical protein